MINNSIYKTSARSLSTLLIVGMALLPFASFAQEKNLSEVIDVVRPYKPILAEPLKIKTNPELNDNEALKPDIDYRVKPIKLDTLNLGNLLTYEKVKTESVAKLYRLYIKAGLGSHLNNIGDLYLNNIQSKSWQYGLIFRQLGGDGIPANTQFNEEKSTIYAKKIFTNASWASSASFNRNAFNFYGYDHDDTSFAASLVKQRFYTTSARTEVLTHIRETEGMNFGFATDAYHIEDHYRAAENGLKSELFFDKKMDRNTINIPLSVDLARYTDSSVNDNLVVRLSPTFAQKTDSMLSFKLGASLVYEQVTTGALHFYPLIHAQYNVIPRYFVTFGGMTGNVQKASLKSISDANPFIKSRITIRNQNEKIALYAGFMSSPQRFFIKMQLKYSYIDNLALFVTDSSDTKRFDIIYDGKNASLTNFTTDLSYFVAEKLRLGFKAELNDYNTATQTKAWNKPTTTLTGTVAYSIAKKFIFNANFFYIGPRKVRLSTAQTNFITLKAATDFNLDIEYRYSKTLSVFTRFDNIRGLGYERWLYYPSYGFNFIAGITFAL